MDARMQAALLPDRGVVKVDGADARRFLNGLLTADIEALTPDAPRFAALLTPQGKILFDGIVAAVPPTDGIALFIDCPRALAADLVQRFAFYKLRAKVVIEDLSETLGVLAAWDGTGTTEYGLVYADPRLPALGFRVILPPHLADAAAGDLGATVVGPEAYEAHRIALGVPRGGVDFAYGDAFPHEADMDQLNGVDFDKGCYVGQEVVSRIEHRARARSRIVPVAYDEFAPADGVPVMAGERAVGTMGSAAGGRGLAMLRLDRTAEALAAGASLSAGGVPIRLVKPDWARFAWPGEATAAE
jgi:tRNA-modifying protein YgfZ